MQSQAATAAGYKNPKAAAYRLMDNPLIKEQIRRKQTIMIEESGKRLAAELNFERSHVLNRLWEIAQMSPNDTNKNVGAQVKAAEALAALFSSKTAAIAEFLTQLVGKTPEEVKQLLQNGDIPTPAGQPK